MAAKAVLSVGGKSTCPKDGHLGHGVKVGVANHVDWALKVRAPCRPSLG